MDELLTEQEWILISSQFVTTSRMKRPKKSLPYAFTELGALMLSSILRSPVADAHILFFLHSTKFKVNIFRSRWHECMSTASFFLFLHLIIYIRQKPHYS